MVLPLRSSSILPGRRTSYDDGMGEAKQLVEGPYVDRLLGHAANGGDVTNQLGRGVDRCGNHTGRRAQLAKSSLGTLCEVRRCAR